MAKEPKNGVGKAKTSRAARSGGAAVGAAMARAAAPGTTATSATSAAALLAFEAATTDQGIAAAEGIVAAAAHQLEEVAKTAVRPAHESAKPSHDPHGPVLAIGAPVEPATVRSFGRDRQALDGAMAAADPVSSSAAFAGFSRKIANGGEQAAATIGQDTAQAARMVERTGRSLALSYSAAVKAIVTLNGNAIDALHANSMTTLEFFGALMGVRSVPEAIRLQTEHACKQFEAVSGQARELMVLAGNIAWPPLQTGLTGGFNTE